MDSEQHWYAIKVYFNKVFELERYLQAMSMETFLAIEKVELKGHERSLAKRRLADLTHAPDNRYIVEGKVIYYRKPMVNSLIFVKAFAHDLQPVDAYLKERNALGNARGFIYRNVDRTAFFAIPANQMRSFRLVVEKGESGLEFFADIANFQPGTKVRVKEGPLKGAEGYIKRIKRNRRLLVGIEGVVAVATSYIPHENLEPIDPPAEKTEKAS